MTKAKTFINKIKQNKKIKKFLYLFVAISLFLYIFSIPAFSFKYPYVFVSYFFAAILVGGTALYSLLYRRIKFERLFIAPLFLVFISFLGTAIFSKDFRNWLTLVLMIALMITFYYSFGILENKRLILYLTVLSLLVFAFYFLVVYRKEILSLNLTDVRLGQYFGNVNEIGFIFSLAFSCSLHLALNFNRKIELLFLISAAIFFGLGLFTGSRSFIVVSLLGILGVLYIRFKKRKFIFLLVLVVLTVSLIVFIKSGVVPFLKEQFDRMLYTLFGIGNSKADGSTIERIVWAKYAWTLGSENIIIGYGVNGFSYASYLGTYSHNNFAEIMCNFGVFGFIAYYLMYLIPSFRSIFFKDVDINFIFVLALIYIMRGFFGVTYYSKDSYLVLAICFYFTNEYKFDLRSKLAKQKNQLFEVSI